MIADYLAAEQPIIDRLKAAVPGFIDVHGVDEIDLKLLLTQIRTPAAHVIYDGDVVPAGRAGSSDGQAQRLEQRWMIVVAVRNVSNIGRAKETRTAAGPLISATIQALAGWAPTDDFRPFRRFPAPRPAYNNGVAFFPLAFTAGLITS